MGGQSYSPLIYENILAGKYPLARGLFIYVVKDPKKGIDPLVQEFLKYVFSKLQKGWLFAFYNFLSLFEK